MPNKPNAIDPSEITRHPQGCESGRPVEPTEKPPAAYYTVNEATGCWDWSGGRTRGGYGATRYAGQQTGAHRAYYAHYVGPIPPGALVRHTCDNPGCVNPAHLELGTQRQNMADKLERARSARGERNGKARLTEAEARCIKAAYLGGVDRDAIAGVFGVSVQTVWEIARGKRWAHLEENAS